MDATLGAAGPSGCYSAATAGYSGVTVVAGSGTESR
jgi:hypothetical protein